MNDNIIKILFFHNNMMFDLKGHIRSNKALYVYTIGSNNSRVKPLLSLYASLSFLSLLFFFSLSLSPPPPPTIYPLHRRNNHPYRRCKQKNFERELLITVSFLSSPLLLLLSLYASLSFLPLLFFFSLSFFPSPLPISTLALYPPYASLSFLSPSLFFFLFLTLTYILMDNFLSLFYIIWVIIN